MSRQVAVVGLAVVILAITLIPITAANGPGPSTGATHGVVSSADGSGVIDGNTQPADDQSSLSQFASERFDRTVFSIEVFENASARWTFRYTHVFGENDTERESFEDFAAEFRGNETALYREFVAGAEGLATTGSNVTDRPMNATAFSRDARTGTLGNTGVVEMSFTWTNFGQQSDGAGVRVSDIFEGGIYIRSDQRLRFVAGPNLAFESADPAPSNTSASTLSESKWVAWAGERTFSDRRPEIALRPVRTTNGETTVGTDGATSDRVGTTIDHGDVTNGSPDGVSDGGETDRTTTAAGDASTGTGMLLTIAGLVLVALGVVVAAWINGYLEPAEDSATPAEGGDSGEDSAGTVAGEAGGEAGAALLSDEDRVRQLLEDNGGRMKQTQIVDATEWSKSKVSMLLSEMEDDDEITKIRIGRENIISLPGAEPEAARSPFEDEE